MRHIYLSVFLTFFSISAMDPYTHVENRALTEIAAARYKEEEERYRSDYEKYIKDEMALAKFEEEQGLNQDIEIIGFNEEEETEEKDDEESKNEPDETAEDERRQAATILKNQVAILCKDPFFKAELKKFTKRENNKPKHDETAVHVYKENKHLGLLATAARKYKAGMVGHQPLILHLAEYFANLKKYEYSIKCYNAYRKCGIDLVDPYYGVLLPRSYNFYKWFERTFKIQKPKAPTPSLIAFLNKAIAALKFVSREADPGQPFKPEYELSALSKLKIASMRWPVYPRQVYKGNAHYPKGVLFGVLYGKEVMKKLINDEQRILKMLNCTTYGLEKADDLLSLLMDDGFVGVVSSYNYQPQHIWFKPGSMYQVRVKYSKQNRWEFTVALVYEAPIEEKIASNGDVLCRIRIDHDKVPYILNDQNEIFKIAKWSQDKGEKRYNGVYLIPSRAPKYTPFYRMPMNPYEWLDRAHFGLGAGDISRAESKCLFDL